MAKEDNRKTIGIFDVLDGFRYTWYWVLTYGRKGRDGWTEDACCIFS